VEKSVKISVKPWHKKKCSVVNFVIQRVPHKNKKIDFYPHTGYIFDDIN